MPDRDQVKALADEVVEIMGMQWFDEDDNNDDYQKFATLALIVTGLSLYLIATEARDG